MYKLVAERCFASKKVYSNFFFSFFFLTFTTHTGNKNTTESITSAKKKKWIICQNKKSDLRHNRTITHDTRPSAAEKVTDWHARAAQNTQQEV